MNYIDFKLLDASDAQNLSSLLLRSQSEYIKYFHPFNFQVLSIEEILTKSIKDKFIGIEVWTKEKKNPQIIGFYMLRGMDEGYEDPMYGVFVDQEWQGKGIAKASLYHAICICNMNSYKRLLLKVHPNNYKAQKLYESIGFQFLRKDVKIDNNVLFKDL